MRSSGTDSSLWSMAMFGRQPVLAERVGKLFQGQTQFVGVDELGDQRDVLARQPRTII